MGYSKSPTTLIRRRVHIESLFLGETVRWTAPFPGGVDAAGWSYRIRECLHVAKKHPGRFAGLARFADFYRVEILDEKTVQASLPQSGASTGISEGTNQTQTPRLNSSVDNEARESRSITIPDATTRFEIVQRLLSESGTGPYHFPSACLDAADSKKLAMWAAGRIPPLAVIRPKGTQTVTLIRLDDTIPDNVRILP